MTREEAIEIIKYASAFNSANSPLTKALDMAIEALSQSERPKGRWVGWHTDKVVGVDDIGDYIYRHCHYYSCRLCGRRTAVKSNYCPNCGSDNRGEEE